MTRRGRAAFATALTLAALCGLSGIAQAQEPVTTITSPSSPTFLQPVDGFSAAQVSPISEEVHVEGTATGLAEGTRVEIYCTWGHANAAHRQWVDDAEVEGGGEFATTVHRTRLLEAAEQTCVLRAVPAGEEETLESSPESFQGPTIGIGLVDASEERLPDGDPTDYLAADSGLDGYMEWDSVSSCGLAFSYPYGPGYNFAGDGTIATEPLFNCAGALYWSDNATGLSEIELNGHSAFTPYGLWTASRYTYETTETEPEADEYPSPGFTESMNEANGDVTITETDPLVYCANEQGEVEEPYETGECPQALTTGVTLTRTITEDDEGRQAQVSDTFANSTSTVLPVTLRYDDHIGRDSEDFESDGNPERREPTGATAPAFSVDGGAYRTYPSEPTGARAEDLASSFSSAPGSIGIEGEAAAGTSGGIADPQGAITYTTAPNRARFFYGNQDEATESPDASDFELEYERTLPASGSLNITQLYTQSLTRSEADGLAEAAADTVATPSVKISSPAPGSSGSASMVTVSGTASDPTAVPTLTVDGTPTAVSSGGAWSTTVALSPGENTITAVATSSTGLQSQAQIAVIYLPPTTVHSEPPPIVLSEPAPIVHSEPAPAPPCVVPVVVGLSKASAKQAIAAANCTTGTVQRALSANVPAGHVISQSPVAGKQEGNSYPLTLFVSSGPASNRFAYPKVKVGKHGKLKLSFVLPDAGTLDALASSAGSKGSGGKGSAGKASAHKAKASGCKGIATMPIAHGRELYACVKSTFTRGGKLTLMLTPTHAGAALWRKREREHKGLSVLLRLRFTPSSGHPASLSHTVRVVK